MEKAINKRKTGGSKVFFFGIVSATMMLSLFQNCAQHDEVLDQASENLMMIERQALEVLRNNCASCHSPHNLEMNPVGDILSPANLIFQGYIVPGEPQNSPLYLLAIDGIMPHDPGVRLSNFDLEILHDWIYALGMPDEEDLEEGEGSGEAGPAPQPAAPTFVEVFSGVIQPRCVSCHGPAQASGNVRLDSHAEVIRYVSLNNPANSQLYRVVNNNSMPFMRAPLSAAQKEMLLNWIRDGAPDN